MRIEKADLKGHKLHQLATVRVAAFWGAVVGLQGVWDGAKDVLPWWGYLAGGVILGGSVAAARGLKFIRGE